MRVQLVLPTDAPLLSQVLYASVTLRRVDVELDVAFLFVIYFLMAARLADHRASVASGRWDSDSRPLARSLSRSRGHQVPPQQARRCTRVDSGAEVRSVDLGMSDTPRRRRCTCHLPAHRNAQEDHRGVRDCRVVPDHRLMSTFGLTALIGQLLSRQLISELNDELAQFAGQKGDECDN